MTINRVEICRFCISEAIKVVSSGSLFSIFTLVSHLVVSWRWVQSGGRGECTKKDMKNEVKNCKIVISEIATLKQTKKWGINLNFFWANICWFRNCCFKTMMN